MEKCLAGNNSRTTDGAATAVFNSCCSVELSLIGSLGLSLRTVPQDICVEQALQANTMVVMAELIGVQETGI